MIQLSNIKKMAIVIAIFLASCSNKNTGADPITLLQKVSINEQNAVLHHVPINVQLLSDSLVAFSLSAANYNVYNIYTGKIIHHIQIDTTVIPSLLEMYKAISNRQYRGTHLAEDNYNPVQIYDVLRSRYNKDTGYIIFSLGVSYDDTLTYKGILSMVKNINVINFLATTNGTFDKVYAYHNINIAKEQPQYTFNLFQFGNKFYCFNSKGVEHNRSKY